MTLATTVSLAVLRGPVPLAKALAALDVLSEGRLVAALGPGSSKHDYDALGLSFDERWKLFDEAIASLRALLEGKPGPVELAPGPWHGRAIPLWIGSRGLEGRTAPGRTGRRRLACICLQHDAGSLCRSSPPPGRRARRSRP